MKKRKLGIIGGSGLYNIEGFLNGKSDLLNIKESIYRDMIKNII